MRMLFERRLTTPEHLIGGEEGLKSIQKEAKRAPRNTEEPPRAPEVRPREPPRAPKRKAREPSKAARQFLSKRPEITEVKIVLPPRRGHDFRCQRRGEGRTCPEGERLTPYVRRSLSAWGSDPTCRKMHEKTRVIWQNRRFTRT